MSINEQIRAEAEANAKKNAEVNGSLASDKVVIDGEELSTEEIKKRMMLQADYTRKTQEIAEQRKKIEEILPDYEAKTAFAQQMDALFSEDPELYQQIVSRVKGGGKPVEKAKGKSKEDNVETTTTPQTNYIYDKKIQAIERELAEAQVDKATAKLQRDFGINDEALAPILQHATDHFVQGKSFYDNLVNSYKVKQFEKQSETAAQAQQRREEKEQAFFLGGSGKIPAKSMTEKDILRTSLANAGPQKVL
jgi:hypothetical protein